MVNRRTKRRRRRRRTRNQRGGNPAGCELEKVHSFYEAMNKQFEKMNNTPCSLQSTSEKKSTAFKSGMSKFKNATRKIKEEVGATKAFSADNLYDSSKGNDDWYGWVCIKSKRASDKGKTYYYKNKDNAKVVANNQVHKSEIDEQWNPPNEWIKLKNEGEKTYYWCPLSGNTVNKRPKKGTCQSSGIQTVLAPLESGPSKKPAKCRYPVALTDEEKAECAQFEGGRKRRKRRKTKKRRKAKRRRKSKKRRR